MKCGSKLPGEIRRAPAGVDTEVNLSLVKAVEEAVEHAWRMQKADFPKESSLKPKLYAWLVADLYFTTRSCSRTRPRGSEKRCRVEPLR